MADTYKLISNIAFVIAVLFLLLSVLLFFRYNILKITGDLSGRNAKKAIRQMKDKAEAARANVFDVGVSFREISEDTVPLDTELLNADDPDATVYLTRVDEEKTQLLNIGDVDKTELLQIKQTQKAGGFKVEKEILFVHTLEEMKIRREYGSV